jgi:hypothetical protein
MKAKRRIASPGIDDKYYRPVMIATCSAITLISVIVRLRLLSTPLERDEGEYAYAGQLILHGFPPYLYAYNMKFPGVYAAYGLIMAIFGQTAAGIRMGLLLINLATAGLIFLMAKRLMNPDAALASAASFALLSLGQPVMGTFAHATHFVILFAVAGLLMLLVGMDARRYYALFASGALLGLALLMKQHAVFILMFGFLYLCWQGIRSPAPRRELVYRLAAFSAGAVIPPGVTGLLLFKSGVFGRFWFWTFTYARSYVIELPLSAGLQFLGTKFGRIVSASLLTWLLVAAGLIAFRWTRQLEGKRVFLAGLAISSALAVLPGFYFREHYFILILPAAALFAGVALAWIREYLVQTRRGTAYRAAPLILLILALGSGLAAQRDFLFASSPLEASRSTYGRNPFPESIDAASYISANTTGSDRIAVIGSEPQIYFYSNRLSATGYIYMYGLMEPQPHAADMQRELIQEVEAAEPRFLVFVPGNESWLRQPDSTGLIFDWVGSYIKNGFDLVGVAEMTAIGPPKWHWDDDVARLPKGTTPSVLVYRRKAT